MTNLDVGGSINLETVVQSLERHYRIERSQIAFLRFIIEAYDGIAVMRTIDAQKGLIALQIPPDCAREVDLVLQDLQKQMLIEPC